MKKRHLAIAVLVILCSTTVFAAPGNDQSSPFARTFDRLVPVRDGGLSPANLGDRRQASSASPRLRVTSSEGLVAQTLLSVLVRLATVEKTRPHFSSVHGYPPPSIGTHLLPCFTSISRMGWISHNVARVAWCVVPSLFGRLCNCSGCS